MTINSTITDVLTNVTGFSSLASNVNSELTVSAVGGGILGIAMWLTVVVTLFLALKIRGNFSSDAFMASAFTGFVLSIFLRGMDLLPDWFMVLTIMLVCAAGVVAVLNKN